MTRSNVVLLELDLSREWMEWWTVITERCPYFAQDPHPEKTWDWMVLQLREHDCYQEVKLIVKQRHGFRRHVLIKKLMAATFRVFEAESGRRQNHI